MKPAPIDASKSAEGEHQFLPLGLACSFFFLWVFSGVGSPAGSVRLMASENTAVIRRSIYLLSIYNLLIYLPLICICICGRAILEDRKLLGFNDLSKSDEVIPTLALVTTESIPGGSLIAGVILAAPFGAVMATVSSYLVVLSSGLVRDVYQRFMRPRATDRELKYMSWVMMVLVGLLAVAFSIKPVPFLQALVVFSGSGAAATFCVPTLMLAFWRRATVPGIVAGMLTGSGIMCGLYCVGSIPGLAALLHLPPQAIGPIAGVKPYFVLGLDPILWGLGGSLVVSTIVSLLTVPPPLELTSKWFDVEVPETMATGV